MSAEGAVQVGLSARAGPAWAALTVCALSAGATLAIALWAWRRRAAARAAAPFAAMALAEAAWNAGHLAELASGTLHAKVVWDALQTAPAVAVTFFGLLFAARHTGRRIPGWLTAAIAVLLAIPTAVIVTAPLGGPLRASAHLEPPYGSLVYPFTHWDLAYFAAMLALALTSVAMLVGCVLQQRPPFRVQTAGLLFAMAFPLVFGFGWLALDLRLEGERDISDVTFALGALVIAWTLARGRLFDLVPVAREAVVEFLTDAILVVDRLGRVVDLNPVASAMLQLPRRSGLGDPATRVLADWPALAALIGSDEPRQEEVSSRSSLGRRWTDARWAPLRDRGGRSVGGTLVLRDVTTLHEARLVLEQRLVEAQKLEAVGRVAAGVAHDFNNLLTVISATVDVARDELPAQSPVRDLLSEAQQAVDAAARVTRQLLTFTRKQPAGARRVAIADGLAQIDAVLRRLAHPATLTPVSFASDLWPITVDPAKLHQILINLVVNARDAMPDGGPIAISAANVTISRDSPAPRRPGEFVRLEVRDQGQGMTEDVRAQLFQPFFTTKPEGQGTGLGLTVVHSAVADTGGFVEVTSSPGRGTAVALFLPRAADQPRTAEAASSPA